MSVTGIQLNPQLSGISQKGLEKAFGLNRIKGARAPYAGDGLRRAASDEIRPWLRTIEFKL